MRAAGFACPPRQVESGEVRIPWLRKFQFAQFPEIEWWQRVRYSVWPGDGVLNRETHVGVGQLSQHRAVRKFHHRMDNALRMNDDFDLRHFDAKQPVRLDHLQPLIK